MTGDVFAVCDVSTWERAAVEAGGLDEKDWRYEPSDGPSGEHPANSRRPPPKWMFKAVTVHKTDGFTQGENWSEKLAAEIGNAINVPCARVELAICDDENGSISQDLRPSGWDLFSGSDLLAGIVEGTSPSSADAPATPSTTSPWCSTALCPRRTAGFPTASARSTSSRGTSRSTP